MSSAKHGLVGMTKALAAACAADGSTASAVSPGRLGDPDPVIEQGHRDRLAELVAFLASPAASEIAGQLIESGPRGAACDHGPPARCARVNVNTCRRVRASVRP